MRIAKEPLERLVGSIFEKSGCDRHEAQSIARHLVDSNLCGHDSHGVFRVSRYVGWLGEGKVNAGKKIKTVLDTDAIAILDGETGFGQTIGEAAVDVGIAKARRAGVAVVALRNVGHLGRIGDWAEQAARAGLASMHFVNTSGLGILVAPTGGTDARLSANPMAWGIPVAGRPPLILDISTSVVAEGKIAVAKNKGERFPPGYLLDGKGQPTSDPATFYGPPRGAILPFGGHKGYGICLFTDLFAGAFTGGRCSNPNNPDAKKLVNNMFSLYLDPLRFAPAEFFGPEVQRLIDWVKASPVAKPGVEIQVPGEFEARNRERNLKNGIEIDTVTWTQLFETARNAGIAEREIGALADGT
jgi:hydroxycarboxylate dehydrogenase B